MREDRIFEPTTTLEGATRLLQILKEKWGDRAQFWIIKESGCHVIRSNLLRGLPRDASMDKRVGSPTWHNPGTASWPQEVKEPRPPKKDPLSKIQD